MSVEDPEGSPAAGLSAEQATQVLDLEVAKRRRIATATQSGSRMVTMALVLGTCASVAAWLGPPEGLLAWAPWVLGALATLIGGFGALRLLAAWQLARR